MELKEKQLYHQIHPLKLFTDISTAFISLYFFWEDQLIIGLIIGVVPSIIISFFLIKYADLEKYKYSVLGIYLSKYMTTLEEAIRLAGYIVMALGAWFQTILLILIGILIVIFGWIRGRLFPNFRLKNSKDIVDNIGL